MTSTRHGVAMIGKGGSFLASLTTMDRYKAGGLGVGLVGGFLMGGPIGAAVGGLAGLYLANKYEAGSSIIAGDVKAILPAVATSGAIPAPSMSVSAKKGATIYVSDPLGGTVTAIQSSLPSHVVSASDVLGGSKAAGGYITASGSGSATVTWWDQFGNTQTTIVAISAV